MFFVQSITFNISKFFKIYDTEEIHYVNFFFFVTGLWTFPYNFFPVISVYHCHERNVCLSGKIKLCCWLIKSAIIMAKIDFWGLWPNNI